MTPITEIINDKQCHACATGLLERDKFCRRCGARQTAGTSTMQLSECATKPLSAETSEFRSYSGQLIKIVTESLATKTASSQPRRGFQRLVCTLITLPIWMLIVLLSPLDAYAAAKVAAGYVR